MRGMRTNCPICKGVKFNPRFSMARGGGEFHIVNCADCGFVFVSDPEQDTANHTDASKIDWAFRPRHNQIRRLLLSRLRPGQSALEIGCGRGEVGYLLRNDGLKYTGYEPARGLSDFGIAKGVPIIQTPFEGNQSADAIIIDNVLEHVTDPAGMLKTARASLNPGGLLIVITPNVGDVRALSPAWRKRNLWIPPDHINYFSSADIARMFAAIGMKATRFKFAPLAGSDWKFVPRAITESLGLSMFGHNVYAVNTPALWGGYDHPGRFGGA